MSSSLFYDCYATYESYPQTTYTDDDKDFKDLKENDILYRLTVTFSKDKKINYEFEELTVKRPLHKARGNYYLSCLRNKRPYNINFGPCYEVANTKSSIIFYDYTKIGTSKKGIIQVCKTELNEAIEELENSKKHKLYVLHQIEKLEENE